MKKLFAMLLVFAMLFALTACATNKEPGPPDSTTASTGDTSKDTTTGNEDTAEPASSDPIRIGVVSTFSGSNSGHGQYCKEGVELWLDNVNANGGILGRPVEIVYEDNGETNQEYQNAFIKMLSEDNVSAIYSNGYSDQVTLVSPDVESYGIPFLAGNSSQTCLDSGYDYYWMLRLSDAIVSPTMANACVDLLSMTNVALLQVNDSYGDGMAEYVVKALEGKNVNVALRLSFDAEETQFNSYLAQVQNAGVDGIIAIAHQDQAALLMMQVDALGFDVPLMGCSQFATSLAIDTAGETADGWYSLADWTCEVNSESGAAFVNAYREKYGRDPDMQSVCSYDAMLLLQDAIERAGTDDPAAINAALYETNNVVGAMTTYTCDPNSETASHCLGQSIFLTQTVNGSGKLIDIAKR